MEGSTPDLGGFGAVLDRCGRLLAEFVGGCCPYSLLCLRGGGCHALGGADVALERQCGGRPNGPGLRSTCLGPGGCGSIRGTVVVAVGYNEEGFGRGRMLVRCAGLDCVVGNSRFAEVGRVGEPGQRMLVRIVGAGRKLFGSSTVAGALRRGVALVERAEVLIVGRGWRCWRSPCRRVA